MHQIACSLIQLTAEIAVAVAVESAAVVAVETAVAAVVAVETAVAVVVAVVTAVAAVVTVVAVEIAVAASSTLPMYYLHLHSPHYPPHQFDYMINQ